MISKNHKQSEHRHDTIEIRLQIEIKTTDRRDNPTGTTLSIRQESPKRENSWSDRRRIDF